MLVLQVRFADDAVCEPGRQIDIGVINCLFVVHFGVANVVRLCVGPFQSPAVVETIFYVPQCIFNLLLASVVSLQVKPVRSDYAANLLRQMVVNNWKSFCHTLPHCVFAAS